LSGRGRVYCSISTPFELKKKPNSWGSRWWLWFLSSFPGAPIAGLEGGIIPPPCPDVASWGTGSARGGVPLGAYGCQENCMPDGASLSSWGVAGSVGDGGGSLITFPCPSVGITSPVPLSTSTVS